MPARHRQTTGRTRPPVNRIAVENAVLVSAGVVLDAAAVVPALVTFKSAGARLVCMGAGAVVAVVLLRALYLWRAHRLDRLRFAVVLGLISLALGAAVGVHGTQHPSSAGRRPPGAVPVPVPSAPRTPDGPTRSDAPNPPPSRAPTTGTSRVPVPTVGLSSRPPSPRTAPSRGRATLPLRLSRGAAQGDPLYRDERRTVNRQLFTTPLYGKTRDGVYLYANSWRLTDLYATFEAYVALAGDEAGTDCTATFTVSVDGTDRLTTSVHGGQSAVRMSVPVAGAATITLTARAVPCGDPRPDLIWGDPVVSP